MAFYCRQRDLDLLTYSDTTEGAVHSTLRSMYGGTINLWVGLYNRKWIWVHNSKYLRFTWLYTFLLSRHYTVSRMIAYALSGLKLFRF